MRKLIFYALLCAVSIQVWSQASLDDVEVGIVEHLDDTVPLDLVLVDEKGASVVLGEIIDKPTILTMVYFDCPGICSPLLDGVSDVVEKSDLELGKEYQIVTVSFNFRDTPEKAREKKKNFLRKHSKERAKHWHYLTTDSTSIYKLIDAIGYRIKPVGLDFVHPGAIIVISPSGKITRYLYGLSYLPFDLKMAVVEAQKEISSPTINRVLEYCFSYDPEGKRYALEVTKVAATFLIILAVILLAVLFFKPKKQKEN